MTNEFKARIRAALVHDEERLAQFDRRVWSIRGKRLKAAAKHPDWDDLRARASAIKAHTVDHLDRYVAEFADRAVAAGAHVHFATDGASANEYIGRLCTERGVRLVTKSKSMTTEECKLNRHLERQGVEVVDTDLGERIVQLIGEPPSHIVAPAIHRNAAEVGKLFHEVMGSDPDETDPARLTAVAREHLRELFLGAQLGITGVNFGVAETGTVVVVENEGNSLLTTSVPDVHVAVMGIEKLIPRWADLAVFLNMLARSATGQRITSYTSHYTGPQARGPGEEDKPPRELHIVLLDNGRSEVLADLDHSRSLGCIRCGACMNVCPVYRRAGGHAYGWVYPGPIGSVLAPTMASSGGAELPFASSLCGACSEACPVGIDLHHQLILQRNRSLKERRVQAPGFRHLAWLVRYPRLARAGIRFAKSLLPNLQGRLDDWEAPRDGRIGRQLPEMPLQTFHEWWAQRQNGVRR